MGATPASIGTLKRSRSPEAEERGVLETGQGGFFSRWNLTVSNRTFLISPI